MQLTAAVEPLVVTSDPELVQKVFPHWQILPPNYNPPSPVWLADGAFDPYFEDLATDSRMLASDHHVWYRFTLRNPESAAIDLALYNHFHIFSLYVVHKAQSVKVAELGYGTAALQDAGLIFPAHVLTIPPGDSTVYLGISTHKHPISLNFELRPVKRFQAYHTHYLILLAGFMMSSVAIFLYNILLFIRMRNRLYLYYLLSQGGLIVLEACITGGLVFLGSQVQANAGNLWIYAACACISGAGLFMLEYVPVSSQKHPKFRFWMHLAVGICALSALTYSFLWRIALPSMMLSLLTVGLLSICGIFKFYQASPKKVSLFTIAFLPLLIGGLVYMLALSNSDNSYFYNSLFCCTALFNTFTLSFLVSQQISDMQKVQRMMETSLKSVMPPMHMKKLVDQSLHLDTKPVVRYVSIMFVDIVGYSLSMRRQLPLQSFLSLKDILHRITQTIHEFGGIIDKSLGDGCLCFFGYDMAGGTTKDHEHLALSCALELQRRFVASINALSGDACTYVYPLRIGINSAEVCIGNMGDDTRFDFTMTGEGVIMASRFETACEPFKIIIGQSTYQAMDGATRQHERFYSRLVPIKHTMPLVESFEVNPFENDGAALEEARKRYWNSIEAAPRDERFMTNGTEMVFATSFGKMALLNFSQNGCCLTAEVFLGKGVDIQLDLTPVVTDPGARMLSPIYVQVLWGVPDKGGGFLLGTKIIGLSENNRLIVLNALKKRILRAA